MRLYPNQIVVLNDILNQVVHKQRVLDHILKQEIEKNKRWGARDRRNIYQAAYDIIRNYELLEYISKLNQSDDMIESYLRYIVDGTFSIEKIKKEYSNLPFETTYSVPKGVSELFFKEDVRAEDNIQAMHEAGEIYLRINTSIISVNDFIEKLKNEGIEFDFIDNFKWNDRKISLNCIRLNQRTHTHKDFFDAHRSHFEFQDIGSQLLTAFIGMDGNTQCIVESCAGNGGKTSHLLDLTFQNQSLILSFDTSRKRLEELQNRIKKWQDHKVVCSLAKPKEVEKYTNMADILYMDMPCSGSGTLKRQSDLKYRISEEIVQEKVKLQRDIFHLFQPTLKKEGMLLYTTCSLFSSENENQVEYISKQGFKLIDYLKLEPRNYSGDGFFAAKFLKMSS